MNSPLPMLFFAILNAFLPSHIKAGMNLTCDRVIENYLSNNNLANRRNASSDSPEEVKSIIKIDSDLYEVTKNNSMKFIVKTKDPHVTPEGLSNGPILSITKDCSVESVFSLTRTENKNPAYLSEVYTPYVGNCMEKISRAAVMDFARSANADSHSVSVWEIKIKKNPQYEYDPNSYLLPMTHTASVELSGGKANSSDETALIFKAKMNFDPSSCITNPIINN